MHSSAASLSKVLPAAVVSTPRIFPRIFTPNYISYKNFSIKAAADSNQIDRSEHVNLSTPVIKSEQLSHLKQKTAPAAPADFPFTPVEKYSSEDSVYLLRKFNGENILLAIYKPENIQHYTAEEEESGFCRQTVELMVTIVKENEEKAVFDVSLCCCHGMRVHLMSVNGDAAHEVDPKGELHSDLQEYLKTRGIEPRYAEYMHKYVVWKFVQEPFINFIKE